MKVRSVANGNVIDLPADHGLVAAGIYVPVELVVEANSDDDPEPVFTPSRALEEAVQTPRGVGLSTPEAPLMTTAHLAAATPRRQPKGEQPPPAPPKAPGRRRPRKGK